MRIRKVVAVFLLLASVCVLLSACGTKSAEAWPDVYSDGYYFVFCPECGYTYEFRGKLSKTKCDNCDTLFEITYSKKDK